jgi:hypothetical protein
MRHSLLSLITPAGASILALALSGCGGSQPGTLPGTSGMVQNFADAPLKSTKPGPLKTTPTKLNFTTAPAMKFSVSESKYKGKFKITITSSPSKVIKISSKSPKGPTAKLTVTALHAGSGKITVSDDHGGKRNVKFTVTQGVIIIQ